MNLQETILHRYKEVYGEKTFASISEHTGINVSRLFRIFNGAKMRVEEFEVFNKLVNSDKGELKGLFEKLVILMDKKEIQEFGVFIERKIKLRQIGV